MKMARPGGRCCERIKGPSGNTTAPDRRPDRGSTGRKEKAADAERDVGKGRGWRRLERLTRRTENGAYLTDPADITAAPEGVSGRAVERLAAYEELQETLHSEQEQITRRLEEMKQAGQTKTVRFRELMVKKMNNAFALDLFRWHGL